MPSRVPAPTAADAQGTDPLRPPEPVPGARDEGCVKCYVEAQAVAAFASADSLALLNMNGNSGVLILVVVKYIVVQTQSHVRCTLHQRRIHRAHAWDDAATELKADENDDSDICAV